MRKAEITIRSRTFEMQEKLQRKLSWRDSWIDKNGDRQEVLYSDIGGEIKFFFQPELGRSVPFVVDVFVPKKNSTFAVVEKFVNSMTFPHEVIDEAKNSHITIEVDERKAGKEFDDIISVLDASLHNSKICDYDIEINE